MQTISLSSKDVAAIVGATSELDRLMPTDWTIGEILESLAALVRCDLLFWTRFDVTTPRVIAEIGYPHSPLAAPTQEWIEHRLEHPICSGLHGPVVALSDVLGPRELHESWLYQECLRQAGWEHEIGLNLSHAEGEIHDVVISRQPGEDFDDRDHLVLRLLHPHLDASFRRLAFEIPALTPRETEVLLLVRDGLTNRQIASALGIAPATVVKHLEHVFARVGAQNRTQAVQLCSQVLDAS